MNSNWNSQTGFQRQSKHLYQMWSWGLRCEPPFLSRIYGKTSFSETLMVFNIVRLRFNCFRILLTGPHRLVHQIFIELEDAKSSFSMWICKRKTCREKKLFVSCDRGLPVLKCGLWAWDFDSNSEEKTRLFRSDFRMETPCKKFVFDIARWTFKYFQF